MSGRGRLASLEYRGDLSVTDNQAGRSQDQARVDVFMPRKVQATSTSEPDTKSPDSNSPDSPLSAGQLPVGALAESAAPASAAPASTGLEGIAPASTGLAGIAPASTGLVGAAPASAPGVQEDPAVGAIHHVELWVPNLDRAVVSWGWLLTALGYRMFQDWPGGRSWRSGHVYIVVEQSPARTAGRHDRCRPGLNHLAFHAGSSADVDGLTSEAQLHGWKLMFADKHPFAGGADHYAAYLESADGFEVELVAG